MSCRRLLALVALFVSFCAPAHAQEWPTRPVTMVVPFAPGGVYDTLGRVYAAALSDVLGQQIVVENVPGAGSMTGAARVSRADPDGYQLLFGGESAQRPSAAPAQGAALRRRDRLRAGGAWWRSSR